MIDFQAGLLIALLAVAIPLVALAQRLNVSYPIALVAGGLVLGFVPGLPKIQLDPNLVLLIFLPPLLYWEAITAPTDIMWDNRGQIAALAFGLVFVTTAAVALLAHAIVPGMSWGVAFVLGAIISPTDELAAVPVLERFRLPRHVIAIVDGESLLNDAAALVIYATALAAVTTGAFGMANTTLHFVIVAVGSVALGLAAGWFAIAMWGRIKDPELQGAISLVLPFLSLLPGAVSPTVRGAGSGDRRRVHEPHGAARRDAGKPPADNRLLGHGRVRRERRAVLGRRFAAPRRR